MREDTGFLALVPTLQALHGWTTPQLCGLAEATRTLAYQLPAPGSAYHHALETARLIDRALKSRVERRGLRLVSAAEVTEVLARQHRQQAHVAQALADLCMVVDLYRSGSKDHAARAWCVLDQMKRAIEADSDPQRLSIALGHAYERGLATHAQQQVSHAA